MTSRTYVVFGAAADLIQPLYNSVDADFICIVNSSRAVFPTSATILSVDSPSFYADLTKALADVSRENLLVFLNVAALQIDKLFVSYTEEDFSLLLDKGLRSHLQTLHIVLREMVTRKLGRIVNFSSFRSKTPDVGTSIYSATKSFNNTLYKSLSLEYGRFDITSNTLLIGFADTKLIDKLGSEKKKKLKSFISKKRFLPPIELLNCLEFLVSSSYVNGAEIELDGSLKYAGV